MRNIKPKIIFIGTPEFGAIVLEGLVKNDLKPCLVITEPDKPAGRKQILTPPPVKILAEKYGVPLLQPQKVLGIKNQLSIIKPDLIIVAAFGQILPKEILKIPKYSCLNIHPSLLPKHRGPSPIQHTILNGEKETGVTIILMDEKMDRGPIISSVKLKAKSEKLNFKELHNKLAELGAELLVETIPKWIKGEIKPTAQDESKTTYTKIIKKEDGKINWKKSAEEIECQIRAFDPWPGSFTHFDSKLLKVLEVEVRPIQTTKQIGEVFLTDDKKMAVRAGQNCLILQKLQLEGKKPMSSEDFLRGHRDFIGTILR